MSENNKTTASAAPPRNMGPPGRGGGPAGMPVEKAKDFRSSFRKLLKLLSDHKGKIIVIAVCAILSTVFSILGPMVLKSAIDELQRGLTSIIAGGSDGINLTIIGNTLLMLLGLYLISSIFSLVQGTTMADLSTTVSYNLRRSLIKKINNLPLGFFNTTSHGDVLSRITNDVDTLTQALNQSLTQLITSTTTILGTLIMMLLISPVLTLVALCIIPLSLLVVMFVVKRSQKYFKDQQKYLGRVNGHVEEMYGGHIVVKAFNGEDKANGQFDSENDKLANTAWRAQFLSGLMQPLMRFIGNLGYVAICIVGAAMAAAGTMTLGGIQAFVQYVSSFTQPITQLATISNQFQQMVAAAERIFEFLEEPEISDPTPKHYIADLDIKGDVKFDHVRFGYEDTDKIVINDFSADVNAGKMVAIVGPTGAGKTTIVKLLMRFHDLKGGAIFLDDYNITDFDRRDLRTEFGMVLQDAWLFNGTIMDNIRYGKTEASEEEVVRAAKIAQADRFIRTLPDGYNMVIDEELTNISQGQKQLLTIARAVLADPQVLILDEATSSVDTRTEILIRKAMDNLLKGRTSFVIAHRLSTIRNADLILVMNDGDIVEQGTHEQLMKQNGFYANLYNSQFEQVS